MGFISFEYAALLASVFVLWHTLPKRPRLWLLLLANYVFYCYWQPYYAWIIGSTTLVDYAVALAVEHLPEGRRRKALLAFSIAFNLGMLGYFKYSNFGLDILRPALQAAGLTVPHLEILLPTGISFYTFQEMGYTIDVYRRRIQPTRDLVHFAAYVSFFPQLVAGPIEKADELLAQLAAPRRPDLARLSSAGALILVGLAKKLVLADRLTPFARPMFADPARHDGFQLLVGLVVMPMALYLDFSAYTDIARGSARLLGVELSRNFLFPFASRDPGELWRRWHMSLTRWIRDYLFVALPGSPALSFILPAVAFGLWHGASWNFVLWGIGNGLALAAYVTWRIHGPSRAARETRRLLPFLGTWLFRVYALLLAPLFFCANLERVGLYWKGLLTGSWASAADPSMRLGLALFAAFAVFQLSARNVDWESTWARVPAPVRGAAFTLLFYLVLFGSVPTAQQFVYVRF
jgi:alginate O-acetyltransferase complex protein AlgI